MTGTFPLVFLRLYGTTNTNSQTAAILSHYCTRLVLDHNHCNISLAEAVSGQVFVMIKQVAQP